MLTTGIVLENYSMYHLSQQKIYFNAIKQLKHANLCSIPHVFIVNKNYFVRSNMDNKMFNVLNSIASLFTKIQYYDIDITYQSTDCDAFCLPVLHIGCAESVDIKGCRSSAYTDLKTTFYPTSAPNVAFVG